MSARTSLFISAALIASTCLAQQTPIDCFSTDLATWGEEKGLNSAFTDLITGESTELTPKHALTQINVCYKNNPLGSSRLEGVQTTYAVWNEDGSEATEQVQAPAIGVVGAED